MATSSVDEERLRILHALDLLDAAPDPSLERFVRIAAGAARSPIALVTFVGPERQVNKARHGFDEPYTPLADSFCVCTLLGGEPLVVPDARTDERLARSRLVTGPAGVRSYAGHPIVFDGVVLGTVCVLDTVPRTFGAADLAVLADLSGIVTDLLALRYEHRQLELQEQRADAARRASESKSEFFSRLSHELRTPLNAILGFTQLMLMDDSQAGRATPLQRQRLDVMFQGGQRLIALVNDMLDLARIEQGRLDLAPEPVDVHGAVHTCELLLRPLCAEKRVAIVNGVQPGECTVLADRRALGQVLLNVLSNAVNYNRAGGRATVRAEAGDPATLVIEDEGAGLTASQLASLYQPFNRLGAEGGPVAGSGLGLVICKALVERMQGGLQVTSVSGKGTRVRITLPGPAAAAGEPAAAAAHDGAACPPPPPSPCTVLYAEDDTINAMLMEELFATTPAWRLLVASTGHAALDVAVSTPLDLILLDMNLPDMTGLQLLHALRERGVEPRHGFVAVSADAFPDQVRRAVDAGFLDYWAKPLDLREVQQRLQRLLS